MKVSLSWLQEWVPYSKSPNDLAELLTMAGLEVDEVLELNPGFSKVTVGEITSIEQHPDAEKLQICTVNLGTAEPRTIVCGANNVAVGRKVPVAEVGAQLPGNIKIKKAKLRGVVSHGMICAASELGLSQDDDGIMLLSDNCEVGADFAAHLNLPDTVYDLAITPNRGDCFSVLGIAREIAAFTKAEWNEPKLSTVKSSIKFDASITIRHDNCSSYSACIVENIDSNYKTPQIIKLRLERAGQNLVNHVVDVVNYIMLETGQPMHAFDYDQIQGGITIRSSKSEQLNCLDDSICALDQETMVVSDDKSVLAIAGVIGSKESAVTTETTKILLESAHFAADEVSKSAKKHGYHSESSHRFERGIDPEMQVHALKRVISTLASINTNIKVSEIVSKKGKEPASSQQKIKLTANQVQEVLGIDIQPEDITLLLTPLGFKVSENKANLTITVPTHRNDVTTVIDIVEEVARTIGYDKISCNKSLPLVPCAHYADNESLLANTLKQRGYNEAICHNMISNQQLELYGLSKQAIPLKNPLNKTMTHLRPSLIPQLIEAVRYNEARQQTRVRLFERGVCFKIVDSEIVEQNYIAAVAMGPKYPQQWGHNSNDTDFYDIKGDVTALLQQQYPHEEIICEPFATEYLHKSQTCAVVISGKQIGIIGTICPFLQKKLNLTRQAVIFQIELNSVNRRICGKYNKISKYPYVARDIAIVVQQEVSGADIIRHIAKSENVLLKSIELFDIYSGEGIERGYKSFCIRLLFQDDTKTLNEKEVGNLINVIISKLMETYNIRLR